MSLSRPALFGLVALPLAFFAAFFLVPLTTVFVASLTNADGGLTFSNYARILAAVVAIVVIDLTVGLDFLPDDD